MPGLGAAAECSCVRPVPGNGFTCPDPYNMQLWDELLQINGLILRLMQCKKDIRAIIPSASAGSKLQPV